jgi:PAS domain S-box-containing protein
MKESITTKINHLGVSTQNVIVGLFVGGFCGYIVKFFYQRFGWSTIVFVVFIVIGALLGFLSGKERERYERLKEEKLLIEEDFDKVNKMLRQSEGKYRLLFENISDAIYLTTDKGKFVFFNEATCLLTGYSREELRRINLSEIQVDGESVQNQARAWLDNGICRFEERWMNKGGQTLQLDVNAKWIKVAKVQCILHVARDVMHRKDVMEEKRAIELAEFNMIRLTDVSNTVQSFYRRFFVPMNNTMDAVNKDLKKLPSEDAKFSPFFMEWEKVRKVLQSVIARSIRSADPNPSNWNLNEVIRQEIYHLMVVTGSDEPPRQVTLSKEIPLLYTSGRDLAIVLEVLFRAVHESLPKAAKKDMSVSSRMEDDKAVVQIQTPASMNFDYHLSRTVDPSVTREESMESHRGVNVLNQITGPLKWKVEIENPESGLLVRLKIPVEGASGSSGRNAGAVDAAAAAGGNRQVIV